MVRPLTMVVTCMISVASLASLGCSGSRMHRLSPESYRYLKDDRVLLTTKDTITLRSVSLDPVEIEDKLNGAGVRKASLVDDSITFEIGRFAGKLALNDIAAVHYFGLFDTTVGLLTNEEIRAYSVTNPFATGTTFAAIGAALAFLVVEILNPFEHLDDELDNVAPTVTVALGAGAGFIYGHSIGLRRMEKEAVEHARSLRTETQKQE